MNGFDREVRFEILEQIGVISTHPTGWNKELNIISWNGNPAKYDIRDWSPDHKHMSRGVTLTEKEKGRIVEMAKERNLDEKSKGSKERDHER